MKRMLMVATVPSMIGMFNMNNILILKNLGYEVHVACDWADRSVWTNEKVIQLKNTLDNLDVLYFQVDYSRALLKIHQHTNSYRQTKRLLDKYKYEFIHCHTPIAGAIARIACKTTNTKCIYTAHGFHFYKGAPLINWAVFYPIEKYLSKYTNILITINKEDYTRAKKFFFMKKTEYIPSVGIEMKKFQLDDFDREKYRKKLKIKQNDFVILSVGELNKNKNHAVIIKAIAKMNNKNIHYFIAGQGKLEGYLTYLSRKYKLENQIHFLGYRHDISELNHSADVFAFPSKREGLGLAAVEAMACSLPLITSNVHGIKDYSIDGVTGYTFKPTDVFGFSQGISLFLSNVELRKSVGLHNALLSKKYTIDIVENRMKEIYNLIKKV